jgi:hypothetical protein
LKGELKNRKAVIEYEEAEIKYWKAALKNGKAALEYEKAEMSFY